MSAIRNLWFTRWFWAVTMVVALVVVPLWSQTGMVSSPPLPSNLQISGGAASGNGMMAMTQALPDGRQQLVVIDTNSRTMAVYHVEPQLGTATLMSVRHIHWDLMMEEFNGQSPSPKDIRGMLQP